MSDVKALEQLISDISEESYAAGWLVECEYTIWAQLVDGPADRRWVLTPDERARLIVEAIRIGGWVLWDCPKEDAPRFVPIDEWLERYSEWETR